MWGNSLGLADQRSGIRGQRNLQRMAREVETKETKTLVLSTKGGAAVGLLCVVTNKEVDAEFFLKSLFTLAE